MNTTQAHEELVMLGVELLAIFALATVADSIPSSGPVILMLLVLLWTLFLIQHSDAFAALFSHPAGNSPGGGVGNLVP